MVELGIGNTRLKDFYDLWVLAGTYDFAGESVAAAIQATFARRRTPLPTETPVALTAEFAGAPSKQAQWQAFLRRNKLSASGASLVEVVALLHEFLLPPVAALQMQTPFKRRWQAGGPWGEIDERHLIA